MKSPIVLLTANQPQAEIILQALSTLRVVHCRSTSEVRAVCANQSVALLLLVDEPPLNGQMVFAELSALQPGLAGILLIPGQPDTAVLQGALEAGFSGLVELPYAPEALAGVVQQALKRYQLQWENARLRTLIPLYSLGNAFFPPAASRSCLMIWLQPWKSRPGLTRFR